MELNEIKYGFKLKQINKIEELNVMLYQYEHLKSGGTVAYIESDDDNCSFAIGFRTLPKDSTGVCHIIEHSLLCGSKKYPLKEPFVNLLKTSMSTFLNAFTSYDWTMYPFASKTPKDFDNILSIYLDAVFNPLSVESPLAFLQEGWHYELFDEASTPIYKGVVYNEMKGAMSSVDEILTQATLEAMYKDNEYRFNSGGDPDVIPSLTYEAYKEFYHKHYTPQNSFALFYGKMDIEPRLKFLDEEYYSHYEKTDEEIIIHPQETHINLNFEKDYPILESEDEKDNTYMSLCYGLCPHENNEETLALSILFNTLFENNESVLKKAILDAKLGQNVFARVDSDNLQPALHITLQKTNKDKKDAFRNVFEEEVRKLVINGIDKQQLLSSINATEFRLKEMDMGRMSKGIVFAMTMMGSFNYRGNLLTHLENEKHYKKFREEINNNYFENLLDKYILNSVHKVQVVLNPSKTIAQEKKKMLDEKLKNIALNWSKEEKLRIIKQNEELRQYQNHIDTEEELATLPSLELKDIVNNDLNVNTEVSKINGSTALIHDINTNQIGYLKLYFNLNKVKREDLPYCILLTSLLTNVSTKKHKSIELNNLIKTYLGALSFSVFTQSKSKDDSDAYLRIYSSALKDNVQYIPSLINEVCYQSVFTSKEIKIVLKQLVNAIRTSIIESGNSIAVELARAAFSTASNYNIRLKGSYETYKFFSDLINNYDYKVVKNKLKEIIKLVFNKENVLFSLAGDKELLNELKIASRKIRLSKVRFDVQLKPNFDNYKKKTALIIPSEVSYNACACNIEQFNLKRDGKFIVSNHIIDYDYLWSEVRVKGGAYGCGIGIGVNNDVSLSSFRDPNVANTFNVFNNISKYLSNLSLDKNELKNYIIGSYSSLVPVGSIPTLINIADSNYLSGIDKNKRDEIKNEVLSTTIDDINKLGLLFEKLENNNYYYATVGNEEKISEIEYDLILKI